MVEDDILELGGGLTAHGYPRNPAAIWNALAQAQTVDLLAQDHKTLVGQIRLMPGGGAGILHDFSEHSYALLSPEDLQEIAQNTPCRL